MKQNKKWNISRFVYTTICFINTALQGTWEPFKRYQKNKSQASTHKNLHGKGNLLLCIFHFNKYMPSLDLYIKYIFIYNTEQNSLYHLDHFYGFIGILFIQIVPVFYIKISPFDTRMLKASMYLILLFDGRNGRGQSFGL